MLEVAYLKSFKESQGKVKVRFSLSCGIEVQENCPVKCATIRYLRQSIPEWTK